MTRSRRELVAWCKGYQAGREQLAAELLDAMDKMGAFKANEEFAKLLPKMRLRASNSQEVPFSSGEAPN